MPGEPRSMPGGKASDLGFFGEHAANVDGGDVAFDEVASSLGIRSVS